MQADKLQDFQGARTALPAAGTGISGDSSTFAWTVRLLSRLKCWKIMPMLCRARAVPPLPGWSCHRRQR